MVSKAKYEKLLTGFLKKWENVISKNMVAAISDLWRWIKDYPERTGKNTPLEDIKLYVKQGVNLLKEFADEYLREYEMLSDALLKCKLAILRNDTSCTVKTKNELAALLKEYNSFVSATIGCFDASGDYMLSLITKIAPVLGDDIYVKRKNDLENICFKVRTQALAL